MRVSSEGQKSLSKLLGLQGQYYSSFQVILRIKHSVSGKKNAKLCTWKGWAFPCLWKGYWGDEVRISAAGHSSRTRDNVRMLKWEKFRLGKPFPAWEQSRVEQVAQKECVASLTFFKTGMEKTLGQPDLFSDAALSRQLHPGTFWSFQTAYDSITILFIVIGNYEMYSEQRNHFFF